MPFFSDETVFFDCRAGSPLRPSLFFYFLPLISYRLVRSPQYTLQDLNHKSLRPHSGYAVECRFESYSEIRSFQ